MNPLTRDVIEKTMWVVYMELYRAATPPADYEILSEKDTEEPHYMLHYIPEDVENLIIEKATKPLRESAEKTVRHNVKLGSSPSNNLEQVNEARERAGLDLIEESDLDYKEFR